MGTWTRKVQMMIGVVFPVLCLLGVDLISGYPPDTLRLVNVVYRHGDRSPLGEYPKDPYRNVWPQGLGWLTTVGMQQQFALGQFLRSEYDGFLNAAYDNTEIIVLSSNVNRSLMSAACNLAGLYPPQGDQIWKSDLLWQPIPIHTRPVHEDNVLAIDENCPLFNELYQKKLNSPAVQSENKSNAKFFTLVEEETGLVVESLDTIWLVGDLLFCQETHNYTLPAWTQQTWEDGTVYNKVKALQAQSFNFVYNDSQLSRLKGGPLVKRFIQNMKEAASVTQHYKMYMYSAHDSTVAVVLDVLKVYNALQPPYAAALLVELHEVNGSHCVQIRYHNDTTTQPYTLVHPDCNLECCPLDRFVAVTESNVPDNWEAECGNIPNTGARPSGVVIALITLTVILAVSFTCLVYQYCVQRHTIKTFQLP